MSKSKIMTLTALITLALGITAIGNAEADEEKNKSIVKRNVEEIWNKGNVSVADEIVATDYVRHLPGNLPRCPANPLLTPSCKKQNCACKRPDRSFRCPVLENPR